MSEGTDLRKARVLEMRRPPESAAKRLTISRDQQSLSTVLATLRAEMDGLTIRLVRERGTGSQASVRAEQISHAIQRLEWALERDQDDPSAS